MLNTEPAATEIISTISRLPGPASNSWSVSSTPLIRPRSVAATAWPPIKRLAPSRFSERGVFMVKWLADGRHGRANHA